MRKRLHVHNLSSQQICRSVPCSSVWAREVVMVCRFLLQTRKLSCTLLLKSSQKCSSFEVSQNAITPGSDSSSWTASGTSVFLSSKTLPCRATLSDKFPSPWNATQPSFPTHTNMSPTRGVAPTVKQSDSLSLNSPYFQFNLVLGKATRTSLLDTFGLNRELLENAIPVEWTHQCEGKC